MIWVFLLQNASADQAKQRAEELSRKKEATQTDLEKAKQEADKFAGLAQDARAEAEKKMQALSLDSTQLDQVTRISSASVFHWEDGSLVYSSAIWPVIKGCRRPPGWY